MLRLVVGVDLAALQSKPTGICILRGRQAEVLTLYTDSEIIEAIRSINPVLVAIDAPLTQPTRRGDPFRECERKLLEKGVRMLPLTLPSMAKLMERGVRLRKRITEECGGKVIEVYPSGALSIWRKKKKPTYVFELLREKSVEITREELSPHELDAAIAALIGLLHLEGRTTVYSGLDGEIIMPKVKGKNYV